MTRTAIARASSSTLVTLLCETTVPSPQDAMIRAELRARRDAWNELVGSNRTYCQRMTPAGEEG